MQRRDYRRPRARSTRAMSFDGETPSGSHSLKSMATVGDFLSRSSWETYVRSTPARKCELLLSHSGVVSRLSKLPAQHAGQGTGSRRCLSVDYSLHWQSPRVLCKQAIDTATDRHTGSTTLVDCKSPRLLTFVRVERISSCN